MYPADPNESELPSGPGKVRTWWHPLLVRLLDQKRQGAYEVRDEVNVGRMPLRIDVVLIRRQDGQLSESAMRDLAALVRRLNRFTLVEFKSPTDALEAGDLDTLLGCAHLFRAQQSERIDRAELNLLFLAPRISEPFLDDLHRTGLTAHEEEPGIHRIEGHAFAIWLIETDRIAGSEQPVLSLFSRVFLQERHRIIAGLTQHGHDAVLFYVLQQIQQFQQIGEGFRMQHTDVELMDRVSDELQTAVLQAIPAEKRLEGLSAEERLKGLPVEEFLKGLSAEELLKGLSAEERLKGLSAEELLKGLSAEELLKGLSAEERLKGLPAEERLEGLSAETLLESLSKEQLERLRVLLQRTAQNP